ncbi:hypothetical protein PMAYCL1PPCAC_32584, partial [Pristionchus mayeri]
LTMILLVTLLLLLLPSVAFAEDEVYSFGPYAEGETVVFQDVLDGLPKICGLRKNHMRDVFNTTANKGEQSYIARRPGASSGTYMYDEAVMDGEKEMIRAIRQQPSLLQVKKGYRVAVNTIEQTKTMFSQNKGYVPVFVYKCATEGSSQPNFATIGSHDRHNKKIHFIDENCNESETEDILSHNSGYNILDLDIYEENSGISAHLSPLSFLMMLIAMVLLQDA